jgi:hypothetical protein
VRASFTGNACEISGYQKIAACYSSRADIVQQSPGTVTKTLRVLDMSTVRAILEELRSVDVNADGR